MGNPPSREIDFLHQLHEMAEGDPEKQVSMLDVGASLGLDENDSGEIAQTLCIKGFAELKTLSGGIGITVHGLKKLNISPGENGSMALLTLGSEPVLNQEGQNIVNQVLEEIKIAVSDSKSDYPQLEEMIFDIKTIEVQLLSPKPKTAIVKEGFRSLATAFTTIGPKTLFEKLNHLISN